MNYEITDVRALVRGRADKDAAQKLLERIATQVLPILTKRRFRVRRLQEFFPKNANLLGMNVNRGYTIYIRLRPQSRPNSFLPYEALLETMLHELTHMVHGPHNQVFYKLNGQYLDELKDEMESLMLRGLVGHEGARFQDAGVGMSIQTQTTAIHVRHANDNRAAVLAAARRDKYQRLLGGVTAQRLGTTTTTTSATVSVSAAVSAPTAETLTPQQLRSRALDAAERRRRDNLACSLTDGTLANAIEILGIDDDDDGDGQDDLTRQPRPSGQQSTHGVIAIEIDEDEDAEVAVTTARPPLSNRDPVVVELLDDDSDDDTSLSPEETQKKPVVADIVDLTDD